MSNLPFGKKNYMAMIAGLLFIAAGLYVMTLDKEPYGFGTLGITVGPILIMLGFVVEFFAIWLKDNSTK